MQFILQCGIHCSAGYEASAAAERCLILLGNNPLNMGIGTHTIGNNAPVKPGLTARKHKGCSRLQ